MPSSSKRGTPLETCREELENYERCNAPAEFIVWGSKLFPPEALGPRCYDHAAERVGHLALTPSSTMHYAIFDLRKVRRAE